MSTPHTAFANSAIDTAVEAVHDALEALSGVNPRDGINLDNLNVAVNQLREVLPQEAKEAERFAHDEFSDSRDYE